MTGRFRAGAALLVCLVASSCGAAPPSSLAGTLAAAQAKLNDAKSFSFTFETTGTPPASVTATTGGSGKVERPSGFKGTFIVSVSGAPFTLNIIEAGGRSYIEPPFSTSYHQGNASQYGFPDPLSLFAPSSGLDTLLTRATHLSYAGEEPANGSSIWSIDGRIDNTYLADIIDTPRTNVEDKIIFGINASNGELVNITIIAPLYVSTTSDTLTITISQYGQAFHIAAP